jgi:hypothetical protein
MSGFDIELPRITIFDQMWIPEIREDGIYLVGADNHSVIMKLSCAAPLLVAGYISGLQAQQLRQQKAKP